jgi:hypothetical protein
VRFEALTLLSMIAVYWFVTPCILVDTRVLAKLSASICVVEEIHLVDGLWLIIFICYYHRLIEIIFMLKNLFFKHMVFIKNADACINTTSLGLLAVKLSKSEEKLPHLPTGITQRPLRDEVRDSLCR